MKIYYNPALKELARELKVEKEEIIAERRRS